MEVTVGQAEGRLAAAGFAVACTGGMASGGAYKTVQLVVSRLPFSSVPVMMDCTLVNCR